MWANGVEVKTLAELNAQRQVVGLADITTAELDTTTEWADYGVANSYELGDADQYDGNKQAVIDEIKGVIAAGSQVPEPEPVAPPPGYDLKVDGNLRAWIAAKYAVEDQGVKLLIGAANGYGQDHKSAAVTGWDTSWTAYVHLYGINTLYAYTNDGVHDDGVVKVTVTASGDVNDGTHRFDAW